MSMELNATGDGPTLNSHDWRKVSEIGLAGLELPEAGPNEETGEASVAETEEVTAAAAEVLLADKATCETEKGPFENEEILVTEVEAPRSRK
ncbi:hypothetical protein JTB14_026207 [Gonioctena quinquepunctata]|nr:hypothetical protein JTB14_026207 [Gonioctena quinquepunctata]